MAILQVSEPAQVQGHAIKQMQVLAFRSRSTCLVSRSALLSATPRCYVEMFLGLRFSSNKTGRTSTVWTTEPHTELVRLTAVLTVSGH